MMIDTMINMMIDKMINNKINIIDFEKLQAKVLANIEPKDLILFMNQKTFDLIKDLHAEWINSDSLQIPTNSSSKTPITLFGCKIAIVDWLNIGEIEIK